MYSTYETFVDLEEYNISRNNYIRPSACSVLPDVALEEKTLVNPGLNNRIQLTH